MADTGKNDPARENEGSKSQEYMGQASGGSADWESNEAGEQVNRYQDPHGNQTLREPSGGAGAGHSRGDESSFLPTERPEGERNPNADSGPMNPNSSDRERELRGPEDSGSHKQPAEGGRNQYGTGNESEEYR